MKSYFVIKNRTCFYQINDLRIWPKGSWSGAEHHIMKFYDRQSAEDFMKLLGFGDKGWLSGHVHEIFEAEGI